MLLICWHSARDWKMSYRCRDDTKKSNRLHHQSHLQSHLQTAFVIKLCTAVLPCFYSRYDSFIYLSFKGVPLQVPHYRKGSDVIQ